MTSRARFISLAYVATFVAACGRDGLYTPTPPTTTDAAMPSTACSAATAVAADEPLGNSTDLAQTTFTTTPMQFCLHVYNDKSNEIMTAMTDGDSYTGPYVALALYTTDGTLIAQGQTLAPDNVFTEVRSPVEEGVNDLFLRASSTGPQPATARITVSFPPLQ